MKTQKNLRTHWKSYDLFLKCPAIKLKTWFFDHKQCWHFFTPFPFGLRGPYHLIRLMLCNLVIYLIIPCPHGYGNPVWEPLYLFLKRPMLLLLFLFMNQKLWRERMVTPLRFVQDAKWHVNHSRGNFLVHRSLSTYSYLV